MCSHYIMNDFINEQVVNSSQHNTRDHTATLNLEFFSSLQCITMLLTETIVKNLVYFH